MSRLAAILIRSDINAPRAVKDTLILLRLRGKFVCIILDDSSASRGMLKKVNHLVAWGEITDETLNRLISERGEKIDNTKYKPFFRLKPPVKGFERKGVKHPFSKNGAHGYRAEKINELISRMI